MDTMMRTRLTFSPDLLAHAMNRRFVLIMFVPLLGCVSPQKDYVAPENVPVARINSAIRTPFRNSSTYLISVMEGESGCNRINTTLRSNQKTLFRIEESTSTPDGYVQIEAGKPIWMRYAQFLGTVQGAVPGLTVIPKSGMTVCEVIIEARFEPGRDYTLFGGPKMDVNPFGRRGCFFGIKDQTTHQPMKIRKLTSETYCSNSPNDLQVVPSETQELAETVQN